MFSWLTRRTKRQDVIRHPISIGAFIFERRSWVLLTCGIVFILFSIVWQLADKKIYPTGTHESYWIFDDEVWIAFLRESGFASLIALILTLVVERSSHERQIEQADKRHKEIAENVFKGVFDTFVPSEIVNETMETILKASLVRPYHHLNFILTESSVQKENIEKRYTTLDVNSSYSVRNITSSSISVPIRVMFSLPSDPLLKSIAHLYSVIIDDDVLSPEQIEAGREVGEDSPYLASYQWKRNLAPNQSLTVRFGYVMAKEESDNEIWISFLPVVETRLNVTLNCRGMEFGADAFHRLPIKKVSGTSDFGLHQWVLNGPILPNQGLVFWWRPREN